MAEDWVGIARLCGFTTEKEMLNDFYTEQTLSVSDIARKLGVGPATIANRLAYHRIPKRARGGANNSHKLTRTLFRFDQRRVFESSDNELARALNCHPSTIYKYRKSVTRP